MNEEKDNLEYNVLTLVDDEGNEHEFELIDTLYYNEEKYVALVPVYDNPEDMLEDSGELVIMKAFEEDGEEFLDTIDDDEYMEIGQLFMERLAEEFDFEDDFED